MGSCMTLWASHLQRGAPWSSQGFITGVPGELRAITQPDEKMKVPGNANKATERSRWPAIPCAQLPAQTQQLHADGSHSRGVPGTQPQHPAPAFAGTREDPCPWLPSTSGSGGSPQATGRQQLHQQGQPSSASPCTALHPLGCFNGPSGPRVSLLGVTLLTAPTQRYTENTALLTAFANTLRNAKGFFHKQWAMVPMCIKAYTVSKQDENNGRQSYSKATQIACIIQSHTEQV